MYGLLDWVYWSKPLEQSEMLFHNDIDSPIGMLIFVVNYNYTFEIQ